MKVMQTRFGKGTGNCTEACYATLLGVPLSEVPDLSQVPDSRRMQALIEWLQDWDLVPMRFPYSTPWDGLWIPEDTPYIVAGEGPRPDSGDHPVGTVRTKGVRHAVVYMNGELWHDPHPSGDGLVEPDSIWVLGVAGRKHVRTSQKAPGVVHDS